MSEGDVSLIYCINIMIGLKGRLTAIDNSGAIICECINVLKAKSARGTATVGDEIIVVINKARPIPHMAPGTSTSSIQKVRRGDMRRAVIVRTKKETSRSDGRVIRFDDNACVLLNNKGEMLGTRVNGVVSSALKDIPGGPDKGGRWAKVFALAQKIV